MFSNKNLKVKLVYMGFGGMIAIFGTLFGMLSSVTAQRDKFGDIECTSLRVVDASGKVRVFLTTRTYASVLETDAKVSVIGDEHGGRVGVLGKDGEFRVILQSDEDSGRVTAKGKDGESMAWLGIGEHGGIVEVRNKDGKPVASLDYGSNGGFVGVLGKDEKSGVAIGISEDGGAVAVTDKLGNVKILD